MTLHVYGVQHYGDSALRVPGSMEALDRSYVEDGEVEERESRNLLVSRRLSVPCVPSEKAVLLPYVGIVKPSSGNAWSSSGDPCVDAWGGITCDTNGHIIKIDLRFGDAGGMGKGLVYMLCIIYCHCI